MRLFDYVPSVSLISETLSWCENALLSLAATIKQNTVGDFISIYMYGLAYLTEEHHKRVKATGEEVSIFYFGPWYLQNQIVMASGKADVIKQIANHDESEEDKLELEVRKPIKEELAHVFGDDPSLPELPATHSALNKSHRMLINHHLGRNLDELHQYSQHCLASCLAKWHEGHSYQNLMTNLSIKIIAKFLAAIPDIPMEYSPLFRQFERLLYEGKTQTIEFSEVLDQLNEMNDKLMVEYEDDILREKKPNASLLPKGFESESDSYSQEEIQRLLIKTKTGICLLTGGNLAMLIMGALLYISQNEPVKERLREELAIVTDWSSMRSFKHLPYLRCILLESLRLLSPVTIFRRNNLEPFVLHTEKKDYHIPKHSVLYAALREGNNNPQKWKNPRLFDPSRFEGDAFTEYSPTLMGDYFAPFSVGEERSCPAAETIVPTIFNAVIASFFQNYDLTLENITLADLDIPISEPAARWHEDIHVMLEEIQQPSFAFKN